MTRPKKPAARKPGSEIANLAGERNQARRLVTELETRVAQLHAAAKASGELSALRKRKLLDHADQLESQRRVIAALEWSLVLMTEQLAAARPTPPVELTS